MTDIKAKKLAEAIVKRIVGIDLGIRFVGGRPYQKIIDDVEKELSTAFQEIESQTRKEVVKELRNMINQGKNVYLNEALTDAITSLTQERK